MIQHSTINNLAFGRNVDEVLRTLQAIQYVQKNPDEVCPAGMWCSRAVCMYCVLYTIVCTGWKPGDSTMIPTPEGSKTYFAEV